MIKLKTMKKISLLKTVVMTILLGVISMNVNSQTITAVNDGDWNDPNIWSPVGVPFMEDSVIINANVTISTLSIGIICSDCAALVINQGKTLTNNYSTSTLIVMPELIEVNGTFNSNQSVIIGGNMKNNGMLEVTGFLMIGENLENNAPFNVNGNLLIGEDLNNNNTLIVTEGINCNDLTNNSNLEADSVIVATGINNGLIEGTQSVIIGDEFTNDSIINTGGRFVSGYDFNNHGSITSLGTTILGGDFVNHTDGTMEIGDSLDNRSILVNNNEITSKHIVNSETMTGNNGKFCVSDRYENFSTIDGSIDICDATPNTSSDVNIGTIASSVTNCIGSPCESGTANINGYEITQVSIFPNPITDIFQVTIENQKGTFYLFDLTGKLVLQEDLNIGTSTIRKNTLQTGVYTYTISNQGFSINGKLVFN